MGPTPRPRRGWRSAGDEACDSERESVKSSATDALCPQAEPSLDRVRQLAGIVDAEPLEKVAMLVMVDLVRQLLGGLLIYSASLSDLFENRSLSNSIAGSSWRYRRVAVRGVLAEVPSWGTTAGSPPRVRALVGVPCLGCAGLGEATTDHVADDDCAYDLPHPAVVPAPPVGGSLLCSSTHKSVSSPSLVDGGTMSPIATMRAWCERRER